MATQLVMCIIQEDDEDALRKGLVEAGFFFTKISSTGGFLRKGNVTLMMGVDAERLPEMEAIIKKTCHRRTQMVTPHYFTEFDQYAEPIEVEVGGAVAFVLDVARTIRV